MKSIKRKSLLRQSKVEYADFSVNLALGCSHGCKFPCYAMMLAKAHGWVKDYEEWKNPKIVGNALELLEKELPKYKDEIKHVHLCFMTDPFMYQKKKIKKMSLRIIEKLNQHDIKSTVLTKGILPKDLTDKEKYGENNEYGITLVSLNWEFHHKFEPNSAPYYPRIRALKNLHNQGLKTWVSIEPYPTPNLDKSQNLEKLLHEITFVDKIVFGKLNYNTNSTSYGGKEDFYEDCALQVIGFCENVGIEYHIKEGTRKSDKKKLQRRKLKRKGNAKRLNGKSRPLTLKERYEISDLIKEEIMLHKKGKIKKLTSYPELGEEYGKSGRAIYNQVRNLLTDNDRRYRGSCLMSQSQTGRSLSEQHKRNIAKGRATKYREEISDLVKQEIKLHREGEIKKFTSYDELIEKYQISQAAVYRCINGSLTEEERNYRSHHIRSQTQMGNTFSEERRKRISESQKRRWEKIKEELENGTSSEGHKSGISKRTARKQEISDFIKKEVELHREGEISELTSLHEIGEKYNVSLSAVHKYADSSLTEEEKKYRAFHLRSQGRKGKPLSNEHRRRISEGRSADIKNELMDKIRDEVRRHKNGEITQFTATSELGRIFSVGACTVSRYASICLSEEDKKYREQFIRSQTQKGKRFTEEHRKRISESKLSKHGKELTERIQEEVKKHKSGEITYFTTSSELGDFYGLNRSTINRYVSSCLEEEDKMYRRHYIRSQTQKRRYKADPGRDSISKLPNWREKLIERIQDEVEEHKNGKITQFTSSLELSTIFSLSRNTVTKYVSKCLSEEDKNYRVQHVRSEARKGKTFTEEHRRRISDGQKKRWARIKANPNS